MKKTGFIALLLAFAMMAASCSENSSSDTGSAAPIFTSSSEADSSSQSETTTTTTKKTTTTTTTTKETTTTEASYDPEMTGDVTTKKTAKASVTADKTPPAAVVGKDLKSYISSLHATVDLSDRIIGSEEPRTTFQQSIMTPGKHCIVSNMKTKELCDPFNDLLPNEAKAKIAAVKPDAQVFMLTQTFEYNKTSSTGGANKTNKTGADGALFGVAFNCANAQEAQKIYSMIMTDDIKRDASNSEYHTEFASNYAIIKAPDYSVGMCFYVVGNNVFAFADYDISETVQYATDKNFKKLDYSAEMNKICKAIGAPKMPDF